MAAARLVGVQEEQGEMAAMVSWVAAVVGWVAAGRAEWAGWGVPRVAR